jgi:alcohol dehydrogenase, propanol-preferring
VGQAGLVPLVFKALAKGGNVICGGIHMSDIPAFSYELLWEERSVCAVDNLAHRNGEEFFALPPRVPVRTTVHMFPLAEAK